MTKLESQDRYRKYSWLRNKITAIKNKLHAEPKRSKTMQHDSQSIMVKRRFITVFVEKNRNFFIYGVGCRINEKRFNKSSFSNATFQLYCVFSKCTFVWKKMLYVVDVFFLACVEIFPAGGENFCKACPETWRVTNVVAQSIFPAVALVKT